ncbi:MAG TPA: response regulator [Burkholderiaceae bacterium]|jgi:two-component system NtrC family sensor kinase|nr:response regulator [Burkholderiaceae bacterium]
MRPSTSPGQPGPTILIVDDTPANIGLLVDYLEDHSFRVVVAQDGEEGIKRAQFAQPDLILLDVMMPGMDGFETCRRLKAEAKTADIPVIFMTALTDSVEKVTGFDAGAVDYVTKPFQIEEVLARVNTHLALRAMQHQLEKQNDQLQIEIGVRLQVEAELRLTQYSVDHATDAIFWLAPDGAISFVNEAACSLLRNSRENLLHMRFYDIEVDVTPEIWAKNWEQIKERRSCMLESRIRAKGNIVIPLESTVSYLEFDGKEHAFVYARDVSERKRTEQSLNESYQNLKESSRKLEEMHQQLLQAEKMASIGQLAAGVAHEINNPIAFVYSNLGTLKSYIAALLELVALVERSEDLLVDHPDVQNEIAVLRKQFDIDYVRGDIMSLMDESIDGVQRVRRIVQDLKDFSRVGEIERQIVDMHAGLNSTLNIVISELRQKAVIKKEYGDLPQIEGVGAQLNQVFLNLLVNAGQAIEADGIITIRTGHETSWAWIEIEDNGCGIAPDNLSRIFEPFFTTKPVGMGTGLGLSLSYGIIAQHGGRIEVTSKVGLGSTFRIWLPLQRQPDT